MDGYKYFTYLTFPILTFSSNLRILIFVLLITVFPEGRYFSIISWLILYVLKPSTTRCIVFLVKRFALHLSHLISYMFLWCMVTYYLDDQYFDISIYYIPQMHLYNVHNGQCSRRKNSLTVLRLLESFPSFGQRDERTLIS